MKNYTAKKLLKLSTKKQKEWVEEQDWYKDENFEQKLHDAPVIGLSMGALENYIIEKITYFQDYGTAGILRDKKYITIKRADELESLGNFTEEEKEFVKEICIDEALDEDSVLQGRRLKINFDNQVLYIVFYGNYSSILGFNEFDFLGIYSNDEEAEKAMSTIGTPIENFLSNIYLSSTRDV